MSKKEIVNIHKTPDGIWKFETFEKPLRTQIAELKQQLARKDKLLAIYKRALELACFNVDCMYCSHFECRKEPYNEKHNCIECGELGLTQKHLSKYFLDLAKEKLEKGDSNENNK